MKIGHDEFQSQLETKADLKYVEAFESKIGQLIKTEKFFLLMVNEVLKLIQQKPEDGVHAKNKKIALMLDHVKSLVNSHDFNSPLSPLSSNNLDDFQPKEETKNSAKVQMNFIDAPLFRQDHNSLPVSQRIRRYKVRTGKNSVMHSADMRASDLAVDH